MYESKGMEMKGTDRIIPAEVLKTPQNAQLDDSGYYTLSKTPSVPRSYSRSSTPDSLYVLTPDVTSLPPPFKLSKDEIDDSPISEVDWSISELNFSVSKECSNVPQTPVSFECHVCRKDACNHVSATINMPLKSHSMAFSPVPGQEIGEKYIDYFKELTWRRTCPGIVSKILSYLTPKELCSVCCVSKSWRQACESDSWAHAKKLKLLATARKKLSKVEKENELQQKEHAIIQPQYTGLRGPLGNIGNVVNTTKQKCSAPPDGPVHTSTVLSRHQLFQEEAKKLLPCESLQPCPRCTSPSRVDPYLKRGMCSRKLCAYEFCTKCCCQFHDCRPCPVLSKTRSSQRDLIGSKSSRHNLKRL